MTLMNILPGRSDSTGISRGSCDVLYANATTTMALAYSVCSSSRPCLIVSIAERSFCGIDVPQIAGK